MNIRSKWNRRSFLSGLGVAASSLLGARKANGWPGARPAPEGKWPDLEKVTGFGSTGNVYEELGVAPLINGVGTMTMLGGSLIPPEVETVMGYAAKHFVSIPDLEVAAGKKIAEMLKLPAGCTGLVTSGAAGAMS